MERQESESISNDVRITPGCEWTVNRKKCVEYVGKALVLQCPINNNDCGDDGSDGDDGDGDDGGDDENTTLASTPNYSTIRTYHL